MRAATDCPRRARAVQSASGAFVETRMKSWIASAAGLALAGTVFAQGSATDEIERYRQMISEGNPAELYEAQGEELWKKPAGPKNATLEKCDLGLGPGVTKGAYAQLPRYFADTDKVQDAESRILTCMQQLQGIDPQEIVKGRFGSGKRADVVAIATWLSGQSKGMKVSVAPKHPKEKEAYALGRKAFYYQAGPHDFSCASCHGEDGRRIRLQDLPNITKPEGAAKGWTTWPAYRVSNGQMWSMQHRLNDCYRQQRFPEPVYTSDLTIALSYFMAANSNGATMATPGIKR
ncbi:MAG: sulfur oxidation c-type cytochrome SoxA [Rubrivivax sp.]|nr:sulfur oxidation c-type cytochrome SoxA [Rubrivivax sp.]